MNRRTKIAIACMTIVAIGLFVFLPIVYGWNMNIPPGAVNTTYYSPSCFLLGFGMQYSFGHGPTLPTGGNITSFHTLTFYWSYCNISPV